MVGDRLGLADVVRHHDANSVRVFDISFPPGLLSLSRLLQSAFCFWRRRRVLLVGGQTEPSIDYAADVRERGKLVETLRDLVETLYTRAPALGAKEAQRIFERLGARQSSLCSCFGTRRGDLASVQRCAA